MSGLYVFLRGIFSWLARIVFNYRIKGKDNLPKKGEGPYIVCANHIAASDPMIIGFSFKKVQICYMAKAELFKNRFSAWFFRKIGVFPVSRSGNDIAALRNTIKLLKDGHSIGIFPQGTRCPGVNPRETEVKGGLGMIFARSEVKVLPVYIATKNNIPKLFKRRTVIVGKPVSLEDCEYVPHKAGEYERLSNVVFDEICKLGEDFEAEQK